jgi:hypothetical protein
MPQTVSVSVLVHSKKLKKTLKLILSARVNPFPISWASDSTEPMLTHQGGGKPENDEAKRQSSREPTHSPLCGRAGKPESLGNYRAEFTVFGPSSARDQDSTSDLLLQTGPMGASQ